MRMTILPWGEGRPVTKSREMWDQEWQKKSCLWLMGSLVLVADGGGPPEALEKEISCTLGTWVTWMSGPTAEFLISVLQEHGGCWLDRCWDLADPWWQLLPFPQCPRSEWWQHKKGEEWWQGVRLNIARSMVVEECKVNRVKKRDLRTWQELSPVAMRT